MNIIVNATAINSGGGLKVLIEFLRSVDNTIKYHFFCNPSVESLLPEIPATNIIINYVQLNSYFNRLLWDFNGLIRYSKKHGFVAQKVISLQNTSIRYFRNVENYTYIQNALPFTSRRVNDIKLKLYQKIYVIFVLLYTHKNHTFIVQTEWLKSLLQKNANFRSRNIFVHKPYYILRSSGEIISYLTKNLIYPASSFEFKNHRIVVNALYNIKEKLINNSISCLFTIKKSDLIINKEDLYKVEELSSVGVLKFIGFRSYQEIDKLYSDSKVLLMPSYIESYGLPILEAVQHNLIIVASDIDVFREVSIGYDRIVFANPFDETEWESSISKSIQHGSDKFTYTVKGNWSELHKIIIKGEIYNV